MELRAMLGISGKSLLRQRLQEVSKSGLRKLCEGERRRELLGAGERLYLVGRTESSC